MIASYALGFQAALVGYCAAATFVTHAFEWMFYVLVAASVVIEKCLAGTNVEPEPVLLSKSPVFRSPVSRSPVSRIQVPDVPRSETRSA